MRAHVGDPRPTARGAQRRRADDTQQGTSAMAGTAGLRLRVFTGRWVSEEFRRARGVAGKATGPTGKVSRRQILAEHKEEFSEHQS